MAVAKQPCLHVMSGSELVGIFTERDIATRVVRWPEICSEPIETVMTVGPRTLGHHETALMALRLMNHGFVRNLPIESNGEIIANLTHHDLIRLAVRLLDSHEVGGDEYHTEHSLLFVDFGGINVAEPLTFQSSANLSTVLEAMSSMGTGLATIVDDRNRVIGEFTEHDIFTKLACQVESFDREVVGDWMTRETATFPVRGTIADGLRAMSASGHRYLVLLGETGRPSGVVTFRGIADYIETAFASSLEDTGS